MNEKEKGKRRKGTGREEERKRNTEFLREP